MAKKPDEITVASLQQYLEELQGELEVLENDDGGEEETEVLQTRIDSVNAALDAIESVQ